MIHFNDYDSLLMIFKHKLHTIDPWVIIDGNNKIFLNSQSCNELICNNSGHVEISKNSTNKVELASNSGLIVHYIDKIIANGDEFVVWMCIESIAITGMDQLFVIHMQIIDDSQAFKLSKNVSCDETTGLSAKIDFDSLDEVEMQITDLLKSGYTQQAITNLLVTSRSSIVRKIHTICKKIGLSNITSTAELRLHLKG